MTYAISSNDALRARLQAAMDQASQPAETKAHSPSSQPNPNTGTPNNSAGM